MSNLKIVLTKKSDTGLNTQEFVLTNGSFYAATLQTEDLSSIYLIRRRLELPNESIIQGFITIENREVIITDTNIIPEEEKIIVSAELNNLIAKQLSEQDNQCPTKEKIIETAIAIEETFKQSYNHDKPKVDKAVDAVTNKAKKKFKKWKK